VNNIERMRLLDECQTAADASLWGRPLGYRRRDVIVSVAISEATLLRDLHPDIPADQLRSKAMRNLRTRYKAHPLVGFPWVTLAMIIAEIVMRIIIQRWFSEQKGQGV
jgi:hypothetical protein